MKKNSRTIGRVGGRLIPLKSPKLKNAEAQAHVELLSQKRRLRLETITEPINVKFLFYLDSKRKPDLSNLYELPQDALEAAGIIENDHLIHGHDGSRRLYDKANPRTEIEITSMTE